MEKHRNLPEGNVGTVVPEGEVIALLDELARLVKELTPHLDHILSDAVMAHQRHVLRDHAGRLASSTFRTISTSLTNA